MSMMQAKRLLEGQFKDSLLARTLIGKEDGCLVFVEL